jgi:hypothetical protein
MTPRLHARHTSAVTNAVWEALFCVALFVHGCGADCEQIDRLQDALHHAAQTDFAGALAWLATVLAA